MKNICVLPFIHSLILPNGNIALCCNSEVREDMPNVSDEGINNLLNNPQHVNVRKEMLAGNQPDVCRRCWDNEKHGIKSYRQQQNLTYVKHFPKIFFESTTGITTSKLKYLDVRFNNTCNLKCVMCSSNYSSSWQEDEHRLINLIEDSSFKNELKYRIKSYDKELYKWSKDEEILKTIIDNSSSLERIHFAGGEPLLAKQHNTLLKELIRLGLAPQLFLSYNTNGDFIDQELLNLWSHFRRVKVMYSIDHIEDKNEYIRFPSNWKTNIKNFELIESSNPRNVDWRIMSTISILNVSYIPEFVEWKISKNFKYIGNSILDGKLFYLSMLEYPKHLNVNILPKEHKEYIVEKFKSFKVPIGYKRSWNKLSNHILAYMNKDSCNDQLPILKDYLSSLDKIRNTDYKKTFPFIKEILKD